MKARLLLFATTAWLGCSDASNEPAKPTPVPAPSNADDQAPQSEATPDPAPQPPKVRAAEVTEVRAEPVTLPAFVPQAETARTETVKLRLQRVLEATQGADIEYLQLDERHEFKARIEILEASDAGATKVRLTYEERNDQQPEGTQTAKVVTPPIVGKAYILTKEENRTTATYEDGTNPPAPEVRAVLRSASAVSTGRFTGLLPTGTLEPEQPFVLDEKKLAPLLESGPERGQEVKRGLLLYRGLADVDGKPAAVFALDAEIERLQGILVTTITLRGEMLFDPETGRLLRATVQGPMTIKSETGAHSGAVVKGRGALTLDASVEF